MCATVIAEGERSHGLDVSQCMPARPVRLWRTGTGGCRTLKCTVSSAFARDDRVDVSTVRVRAE